jgi:hypothetical protein
MRADRRRSHAQERICKHNCAGAATVGSSSYAFKLQAGGPRRRYPSCSMVVVASVAGLSGT